MHIGLVVSACQKVRTDGRILVNIFQYYAIRAYLKPVIFNLLHLISGLLYKLSELELPTSSIKFISSFLLH
jgi:hypothetical protein